MCDIDSTQLEKDLWTMGRYLKDKSTKPNIVFWHTLARWGTSELYHAKVTFTTGSLKDMQILIQSETMPNLIQLISQNYRMINSIPECST